METGLACSTATGPKFGNCKNSQSISLENMSPDPASICQTIFSYKFNICRTEVLVFEMVCDFYLVHYSNHNLGMGLLSSCKNSQVD